MKKREKVSKREIFTIFIKMLLTNNLSCVIIFEQKKKEPFRLII
jgi:hypothetical protein